MRSRSRPEDHFGIHESIFFSHFARAYGGLDDDLNFRRFAAEFTTSDYYMLTGLPPDWLLSDRPGSYPEAFRNVIDEMARRRGGVQLWIEKSPTHTLLAEELAAAFPDARFVGIERRPEPVIASQLRLDGDEPPRYPGDFLRLLGMCLTYSLNQRWLARSAAIATGAGRRAMKPCPRTLRRETERICAFFGMGHRQHARPPLAAEHQFRGATPGLRDPSTLLTARWSPWPSPLMRLVPLSLLRSFHDRRKARHGIEWPDWCWRRRDAGIARVVSGGFGSCPLIRVRPCKGPIEPRASPPASRAKRLVRYPDTDLPFPAAARTLSFRAVGDGGRLTHGRRSASTDSSARATRWRPTPCGGAIRSAG